MLPSKIQTLINPKILDLATLNVPPSPLPQSVQLYHRGVSQTFTFQTLGSSAFFISLTLKMVCQNAANKIQALVNSKLLGLNPLDIKSNQIINIKLNP